MYEYLSMKTINYVKLYFFIINYKQYFINPLLLSNCLYLSWQGLFDCYQTKFYKTWSPFNILENYKYFKKTIKSFTLMLHKIESGDMFYFGIETKDLNFFYLIMVM